MREWRYTSIILDLGNGWKRVVSFTLLRLYLRGNIFRYPLDPEPVWTLWGRESPAPAENRIPAV
jgi:hypothetical protein